MPSNTCGICGAKLLTYENPDRTLCPRENKHYLFTGGTVGNPSQGGKKTKR